VGEIHTTTRWGGNGGETDLVGSPFKGVETNAWDGGESEHREKKGGGGEMQTLGFVKGCDCAKEMTGTEQPNEMNTTLHLEERNKHTSELAFKKQMKKTELGGHHKRGQAQKGRGREVGGNCKRGAWFQMLLRSTKKKRKRKGLTRRAGEKKKGFRGQGMGGKMVQESGSSYKKTRAKGGKLLSRSAT